MIPYHKSWKFWFQQKFSWSQTVRPKYIHRPVQAEFLHLLVLNLFFQNSNVLSAILCLIKEIDGPSLEVVEMAVRCRMEELED